MKICQNRKIVKGERRFGTFCVENWNLRKNIRKTLLNRPKNEFLGAHFFRKDFGKMGMVKQVLRHFSFCPVVGGGMVAHAPPPNEGGLLDAHRDFRSAPDRRMFFDFFLTFSKKMDSF